MCGGDFEGGFYIFTGEKVKNGKQMEMLTLIVPCYNEQDVLHLFYQETTDTLKDLDCSYELIFINDGSTDGTLNILKELSKADKHVNYISLSRNFGKEAAMYAGFCSAHGDYVAVLDADMQDPPYLLPKMLSILQQEPYDSVATRRENREGEPPVRSWFAHRFYKIMNRISDADIVDGARDFRLMKRQMADAVVAIGEYNRFSKGIFGWIGFRTYWMPYENVERAAGETKWSFLKLTKYAVDGIVNFSQLPLNISSWIGIFVTFLSFVMMLFVIARKLAFGDPVAGWASLICVMIFIGGIQLFCIGIMGQYLAKIYMETKKRPHYIVAESNMYDIKMVL